MKLRFRKADDYERADKEIIKFAGIFSSEIGDLVVLEYCDNDHDYWEYVEVGYRPWEAIQK